MIWCQQDDFLHIIDSNALVRIKRVGEGNKTLREYQNAAIHTAKIKLKGLIKMKRQMTFK